MSQIGMTQQERDALADGAIVLVDSLFDEYGKIERCKPDSILSTRLGKHLPPSYSSNYTPVFFKGFGMCAVSMAWKFAQSRTMLPSSVAEQLAAWAILEEAKWLLQQPGDATIKREGMQAFQTVLPRYFPDASFLLLFDPGHYGRVVTSHVSTIPQTSFAFKNWFSPFPSRTQSVHPYAGGSEQVGRAYKQWLTGLEREALTTAIDVLIDEIFEDWHQEEGRTSRDTVLNTLSWHLPSQYSSHYTPLFLKKFAVCILTVAWKLAQPKQMLLSSIAEEMAAWAIITAAKRYIELNYDAEGKEGGERAAEYAFEPLIEVFFEDEDFLLLFEKNYSGIHASPVGQMMGMTSLAFADWMKPFTNEKERIAHPYVWKE